MIDQDSLMGMSGRTTEDLFEGNNVVQSSANIPTGPQQQPYTEESIDPQLLGLPISPLTEEQLPASQLIVRKSPCVATVVLTYRLIAA